jgi:hypothetical protein
MLPPRAPSQCRLGDGLATWSRYDPPAEGSVPAGLYQRTANVTFGLLPQIGFTRTFSLRREDVSALAAKYVKLGKDNMFSPGYYADLEYTRIAGAKTGSNRTAYENRTPGFWVRAHWRKRLMFQC